MSYGQDVLEELRVQEAMLRTAGLKLVRDFFVEPQERYGPVRVFILQNAESGVILEFRVLEKSGGVFSTVENPAIGGSVASKEPGMFTTESYLTAHNRTKDVQLLPFLCGPRIREYVAFVASLAANELRDLFLGERWESIQDIEWARHH